MAIMVAGGLTFAVPGADPVFAEVSTSNPNLYVSAEGQDPDNMFAEGNIIEVIIRDDSIGDTDEGEAEPEVTVNGADLRMLQTANGYWTAYFAEVDALAGAAESLPYGVYCSETAASAVTGLPLSDGNGVYLPPGSNCNDSNTSANGHPLIREPRDLTNYDGNSLGQLGLSNANLWPFIQVYDFTSLTDVDIVYNKGGDRQTVTLTFDDPSESHSLDRTKYPQGAHVHIELMDYALNIDPTDEDTWVFDTQNGGAYYNVFDEDGNPSSEINAVGSEAGIDETVSINRGAQGNDVIDCQVTKDFGIQEEDNASRDYLVVDDYGACVPNVGLVAGADDVFTPGNFAIGFVEDGSNNNVFINWAEDQRSNIVVKKDALRGNSFEVDYSSPDAKSGVIGHFFAELALDVPDDTWNSGERIPITLTDEDANVNPLAEDNLEVANPYSLLVPSIRIGSPVTLASATGDVVWFDLADPLPPDTTDPVIRLTGPSEIRLNVGDTYTERGATCTDARDGNLTVSQTSAAPNTNVAGTYTLMYTCTDTAGNSASVTRVVTVDDPDRPDTDMPVITVNPGTDTITAGDTWTDAGASCTDARDGPLTVTTTGTVTNTAPGTYTITYACEDNAGNSATETRTVTVNARQATISLTVDPGQWDDGVIELDISGTTVNVADGIVTLTSDTIPNFGEYDVTVTSNVISGMIPFANVTVSGTHTFTATTSDGSISGSDTANIPPAMSLTNVVHIDSWIDADDVPTADRDYITLRVAGTESVSGPVTLSVLDEDGELTDKLGLPVQFGDNGQVRINITDTSIQGPTQFVLTTTYAGVTSTSNSWTANMPVLLTLDDIIVNEWDNGSLILNITGTKQAIVPNGGGSDNVDVRVSGTTTIVGSVEGYSDGVVNGTVTLADTDWALSGTTVQFELVEDTNTPTIFTSDPVARDIPSILTNLQVTTTGSNAGQWNDGNFEVRVTGSSDGIPEDTLINLEADNGEAWIPVVTGANTPGLLQILAGGDIRATVSIDDINLSGNTVFRLVTATNGATSNNSTAINIPSVFTSLPVITADSDGWGGDNNIDINALGTSGLADATTLQLRVSTGGAFTDVGATSTIAADANGAINHTGSLTDLSLSGTSATFILQATTSGIIVMSDNVTVSIPAALTLADVSFGNAGWTGEEGSQVLNLFVTGSTTLTVGNGASLEYYNEATETWVPVPVDGDGPALVGTIPDDGAIADAQVILDDPELAGDTVQLRLVSTDDTTTAASAPITRTIPALPPSSSSVDMAPTPISFSAQNGFPPITRAVINDISEIPAVHNVQASSPVAIYTWSDDDKTVEAFSDRLRLSEPSERNTITGNSKIVIYGWEPPTFADGVTTLFNWNFGSILSDSIAAGTIITEIRLANAAHTESVLLGDGESGLVDITAMKDDIEALGDTVDLVIMMDNTNIDHVCGDITLVADFFTFGQNDDDGRVNNAIYRIEVEEASSNSADFEGTVEYTMLNQLNIDDPATYTGLRTISDQVSIIVHEDFTDEDSVRVNYLDLGADGVSTQIAIQQAAPTHSAVVSFDAESYKVADTVTITLEDADLNVQNDVIDIYTFSSELTDYIGDDKAYILDVTFDDELWTSGECEGADGFASTGFTLQETAAGSGVFTGDFQIPEYYCQSSTTTMVSVTGVDIEVNYQDFRDASGEEIEVGAGAAVRANTGTVSLDRTVYPVPFAADVFEHTTGTLGQHDLTVHVTIDDPDFDISAAGEDVISNATEYLTVQVIRGSASQTIDLDDAQILETAPDSGAFELDLPLAYDAGPDGSILQGDILQVEYRDPTDASGEENTVTDSATFDLRNGVLQSDKSVYIIGSDMILTLIEPDLDLENDGAESYTLDLIEWDSDAATLGMDNPVFDPEPSELRETGDSTGIFQVIVEIPAEIDGDRLERGEEIELEYVDWGPSGADYVGDESEDVGLTVFTSNFGATIELDQKVYTWTDKVYITIVAPDHNFDSALVDEIGDSNLDPIQVSTRSADIDNYKLVETGPDTGIFTGEVILIGFDHNADGDTETGTEAGYDNPQRDTSPDGSGPTNGYLQTDDDDGITVSFEYSEDETVVGSALIRWNIGEVQWLESSYPASGTGVVRVIDPDMNWNPEAVNNFVVDVWSDADNGGIDLTVTETNEATGIFEGTVFFTITDESSGHRLRVAEGNTVTAEYEDNTLPDPYTTADELDITATTLIGTIVPPLERAPATNLRIVDAFGNSLDTVSADQQVQIVADLANGQDRSQAFAYLVQVQDANGVTVALSWISGTLEAGQSLSPSTSWIPSEAGTYTATAFVWESVDNPTALSPPVTTDITVS